MDEGGLKGRVWTVGFPQDCNLSAGLIGLIHGGLPTWVISRDYHSYPYRTVDCEHCTRSNESKAGVFD